jgi:undecaprenyl-diphosphatase
MSASRRRLAYVTIFQAIVLGLTQGATEFAPVSSSGHLILVPWVFGWSILDDPALNQTFDVALHMGTLVGALIYFRVDVVRYARAFIAVLGRRRMETVDERLAVALVVGTVPAVAIGATLEDVIQDRLGEPWLIATMLAAFGLILYAVDAKAPFERSFGSIGPRTGIYLGTAQALALQPGVSRSGVTMTAARAIGLDRESAARFSFLLSLPVIFGAGVFAGADLVRDGFQGYGAQFFWGTVSSGLSGFVVIWFLLRYLRRHDFRLFFLYRLAAAVLVFALIAAGVRDASV